MWLPGVSIQSKSFRVPTAIQALLLVIQYSQVWGFEVSPPYPHKKLIYYHYLSFSLHRRVLPVVLDVGTNNEALRHDPR